MYYIVFLLSMACFLTSMIFGSITLLKFPSKAEIEQFLNSEITEFPEELFASEDNNNLPVMGVLLLAIFMLIPVMCILRS